MPQVVEKLELIKYRDWGMPTYTFFWVNQNNNVVSPYFESEKEAHQWVNERPSLNSNV